MLEFNDLLFKYTTNASRFLVLDGMLVHYRDEGEGEPILLIHGAFSSLHTYNEWTKVLSKKYRVIRLDLMGLGLTGPNSSSDYSIDQFVQFLRKFLNIMNIERCHIAGNSLGGWLAWCFTYRYPQKVNKLILLNSAGFVDGENLPVPFKIAQAPLFSRIFKYVLRKSVFEQFVKQVFFDQSKVTDAIVNRYFDLFTREGNSDAFLHLVNMQIPDNTAHLSSIQAETLILWGQEDLWIPVHNAYRFRSMIPNAQLKIFPQVGHIPMEEIPQQSVQEVLNFLEGQGMYAKNAEDIKKLNS